MSQIGSRRNSKHCELSALRKLPVHEECWLWLGVEYRSANETLTVFLLIGNEEMKLLDIVQIVFCIAAIVLTVINIKERFFTSKVCSTMILSKLF